jgi:hypothetical protein
MDPRRPRNGGQPLGTFTAHQVVKGNVGVLAIFMV